MVVNMYDFSFGNYNSIIKNQIDYLIFIKRLLPRWVNGIPDSEYIALFKHLKKVKSKKPVLLETGSGASTLALVFYAALNNGTVYSWDTNGSKGSFLRLVLFETIGKSLKIDINKIWSFIPYDSTNSYVGIQILKEKKIKGDFCFFDSLHTLDHLLEEVKKYLLVAKKGSLIALDDAYYNKKKINISYVNMLREKLSLPVINELKDNVCQPFYIEIIKYLKKSGYKKSHLLKSSYSQSYKKDIFFEYYSSDRNFMNRLGMEDKKKIQRRYEAIVIK